MASTGEAMDVADTAEEEDQQRNSESESDEQREQDMEDQPASSDNEEMDWQDIQEDTDGPSPEEIRECFTNVTERDARDDAHWTSKLITTFKDPEYRAGDRGKIVFDVNNFNGTREQPNKELIMKSGLVDIGGFTFRIQVYPKGNLTNHLAVYLECTSLAIDKEHSATGAAKECSTAPMQRRVDNPIPMSGDRTVQVRASVAAHVVMVAYNPCEPRVFKAESGQYQFTSTSPDWGWSRFAGPITDLGKRERGMRAPLLQSDRVCFVAYIQTIDDVTGNLYERAPKASDSYLKTGLFPLSISRSSPQALVPAISLWLLMKPFRQLIHSITGAPDTHQRPIITALRYALCSINTIVHHSDPKVRFSPVSLFPLEMALHWYGIRALLTDSDVVEIWKVLYSKLEEELADTPHLRELRKIFVTSSDERPMLSTIRVPANVEVDLQTAIDRASPSTHPDRRPPLVLHVEREIQNFDAETREWRLIRNQGIINNTLTFADKAYTLYGLVQHKGSIKHGSFSSLVRPKGVATGWYQYYTHRSPVMPDGPTVQRVTERQAMGHEKMDEHTDLGVPYLAVYIQQDVLLYQHEAFQQDVMYSKDLQRHAQWQRRQVFDTYTRDDGANGALLEGRPTPGKHHSQYVVHAINSEVTKDHAGPGLVTSSGSTHELPYTHTFFLSLGAQAEHLRDKIAELEGSNVIHPAQVKIWPIDCVAGQNNRPKFVAATDDEPLSIATASRPPPSSAEKNVQVWCWYHIHKTTELNELLKADEKWKQKRATTTTGNDSQTRASGASEVFTLQSDNRGREDTIMSDTDQPTETSNSRNEVDDEEDDSNRPLIRERERERPTRRLQPIVSPPLSSIPSWARFMQASPENAEILFFLKLWDPERQSLSNYGSFFARYQDRIDHTVFRCLETSRDHSRPIWHERDNATAISIKRKKTFESYKLTPGCIIIIRVKAEEESEEAYSDAVFETNGFLDLNAYLRSLSKQIAFPHYGSRSTTQLLKYFGKAFYEGPLLHHKPHGHGKKIYMSGDIYQGTFKLGERHGLGHLEYANGDVYDGQFCRDKRSGNGRMIECSTGNIYEGEWYKDRPHGVGITHWKKAEKGQGLCSMCWDEISDAVLIDCGHIVGCLVCSKKVECCPVCRKPVVKAIKFYYA